jgi:cytochrome o ubiquinol oxidase operon protein cyoD
MNDEHFNRALKRYVGGGVLAAIFTGLAFLAAMRDIFTGTALAIFVLILAVLQLIVHMRFFLFEHETIVSWRSISFYFTIFTALVVIIGSLWIMTNLNYNMGMSPEQMNTYMLKQKDKGF